MSMTTHKGIVAERIGRQSKPFSAKDIIEECHKVDHTISYGSVYHVLRAYEKNGELNVSNEKISARRLRKIYTHTNRVPPHGQEQVDEGALLTTIDIGRGVADNIMDLRNKLEEEKRLNKKLLGQRDTYMSLFKDVSARNKEKKEEIRKLKNQFGKTLPVPMPHVVRTCK